MRKMNYPNMEIVRFNEADVIVASGLPTLKVEGANNVTPGDLVMQCGDYQFINKGVSTPDSFYKDLQNYFGESVGAGTYLINSDNAAKPTLSDVVGRDNVEQSTVWHSIDGTYYWNAEKGYFEK